tara:strand:+ start:13911 stop:14822 length:912 start_codon:yes stop_codon:yes gene_type:complete
MRKLFYVKDDFVSSRLDKWFKKNVSQIPQSLLEKNIRKGYIKVNNLKKKSSYKLQKNDCVTLYNLNFKSEKHKKTNDVYIPTIKDINYSSSLFIENNENFVVINKPSGISVQRGTKSKRNIIDILKKTNEFKETSPYPVHRIDKETTGVLIVAKNRKYAQILTSLFRIRKIHKTYLGIVIGNVQKQKGTFFDELFYYEGNKRIKTKAITHYKVLNSNNNYTFLELNPETGRKHQLRKQLLIHGHPILGDTKYNISTQIIKKNTKLMLHAHKIYFSIDGVKYNFNAKLPLEFENNLKQKYLKNF